MEILLLLYLCPFALIVLLVGGIAWLFLRGRAPHTYAPNGSPAPAAPSPRPGPEPSPGGLGEYVAFDRMVAGWAVAGRIDAGLAAMVRDLIAEDWAAAAAARGLAPIAPAPLAPAAPGAPQGPATIPSPVESALPLPNLAPAGPEPALPTSAAAEALVEAPLPADVAPDAAEEAPRPAPRATRPSLGAALLSLGTRRTLLFLGTFLLLMSSLTLVIFSWASLPPAVQLAILMGTTGAIWAGGAWMARRPDLETAGRNLQAVAALLVPVVGFALGRPGLLDLGARPAWQLASAVSLGAYLLAAWRTRRPLYSGAASLAAASLLLASLGALSPGWQLVPVASLLAALLPGAGALRGAGESRVAEGPRWVALVGGPLTLSGAALLYVAGGEGYPLAAALAVGAVFCGLAYRLEGRAAWLWAAAALPPAALELALGAAGASLAVRALAFSGMALAYLGLCAGLEGRLRDAMAPLFAGALGLGLLALPLAAADLGAARLALLPLALQGAAVVALVERGRLAWLEWRRPDVATGGLSASAALLACWLGALLELWVARWAVVGLLVLPLAGLYFAGARLWPGRLRPGYDRALQLIGVLVALAAGGATLAGADTRLPGALLVAAIFGGQALARRLWPWAAASLVAAAAAAGFAAERLVAPPEQLRALTLASLALAAAYSLGGERLRRTGLRYWAWPGVVFGGLAGLLACALALIQLPLETGLFSGVLLALAALLGAHTALWRRADLGYGAAPLLVAAALTAAGEGFFTGWRPAAGDLAYVACALALGLALLGRGLRRYGQDFGLPYELAAFLVLPAAPLLAGGDLAHLTITWAAMAALYGAALWRYRLPWMLALAFVCADFALLFGSAWLLPGGDPAGAGLLVAAAVAAQALFSAWARRRPAPLGAAGPWGYLSAAIGGFGALTLAAGSPGYAAAAAGVLAATLAALVWAEGREGPAWAALGLLAMALGQLHRLVDLPAGWSLLAGSLEALAVYAGGWGVQGLAARLPRLSPWRRPLAYGAGGAVVALPLALAAYSAAGPGALLGAGLLLAGLGVGLFGWRERMAPMAGVAAGLWALAMAAEGPARDPAAWSSAGPALLVALTWVAAAAAVVRRLATAGLRAAPAAGPLQLSLYWAAGLAGLLAARAALGVEGALAAVCLGLAGLAALAATVERREPLAWAGLGLALGGAWLGHRHLGLAPAWAAAWLVLELVGVSLLGWAAAWGGLGVWRRPTAAGAAGAAALLTAIVAGLALGLVLPALTFALASLGLVLATVAVRERELWYAYGAGAAFVGATLCQLADWGFSEAQWYVIPAGLYLLALAWGLRRFQGQRAASQLVESAGVVLLLGVTFGQLVLLGGGLYALLLFGEALAVAGYGALMRLRAPFVGGVAFFVAGVTWMTLDSVLLANQWVLLGVVGLLMVLAYVVLERHQERLVRAGRHWVAELQSWG